MKIVGGARVWLERLIAEHRPERVVSLLSPGEPFPLVTDRPHLRLEVHDICEPFEGLRCADEVMVGKLIDFVGQPPPAACILAHCSLGVSRSPAAALVIAGALRREADALDLAQRLRTASPICTPNRRIVALGDRLLDRGGSLLAASDAIGRGVDYTEPASFAFDL